MLMFAFSCREFIRYGGCLYHVYLLSSVADSHRFGGSTPLSHLPLPLHRSVVFSSPSLDQSFQCLSVDSRAWPDHPILHLVAPLTRHTPHVLRIDLMVFQPAGLLSRVLVLVTPNVLQLSVGLDGADALQVNHGKPAGDGEFSMGLAWKRGSFQLTIRCCVAAEETNAEREIHPISPRPSVGSAKCYEKVFDDLNFNVRLLHMPLPNPTVRRTEGFQCHSHFLKPSKSLDSLATVAPLEIATLRGLKHAGRLVLPGILYGPDVQEGSRYILGLSYFIQPWRSGNTGQLPLFVGGAATLEREVSNSLIGVMVPIRIRIYSA
ncbi:hypothetical protein AG1IA_01892 [Rhizoctonia solani AG-1 IA]|uniref:Uncharacterized protein n=1 Tax=Thanatephorus cucumeris (strain AG1-IA) TaxID=983506 RepID=L8X612_THACA|nr:hypothetical protein AG1IA_01892 [Rhizoctonia solani AG-1 IA]